MLRYLRLGRGEVYIGGKLLSVASREQHVLSSPWDDSRLSRSPRLPGAEESAPRRAFIWRPIAQDAPLPLETKLLRVERPGRCRDVVLSSSDDVCTHHFAAWTRLDEGKNSSPLDDLEESDVSLAGGASERRRITMATRRDDLGFFRFGRRWLQRSCCATVEPRFSLWFRFRIPFRFRNGRVSAPAPRAFHRRWLDFA